MQIPRRKIEGNLVKKGFVKEIDRDHRYFHHEYGGRRTGISTYTSHGSSYKDYGDSLLQAMKKQLKLDNIQQVKDLFECPMTAEQFNQILVGKKLM